MKKKIKDARGITLVALIITVIIMIILGSVVINVAMQNGMVNNAQDLTTLYNSAENEKNDAASGINSSLQGYGTGNFTNISADPNGIIPTGGDSTWSREIGVVEIAWLDMDNNVIPKPLAPNMTTDMTPIKWNGTTAVTAGTYNNPDNDWYSYTAQTGATDGGTSKWANARTPDGSYWVWIPRYAYKIIYFTSTSDQMAAESNQIATKVAGGETLEQATAEVSSEIAQENADAYRVSGSKVGLVGYSTVYGMVDADNKVVDVTKPNPAIKDKVKTDGYTEYIPHPAFLGTGYEELGGGFGADSRGISGFWIAKFETSMEDGSETHVETSDETIGNVATENTIAANGGTNNGIKAVSIPGVTSWRYINIANCYDNSYNYDRAKESHLIKNSEWGAVAFLAHSKYGRNGTAVTANCYYDSSWKPICMTGGGTGITYATTNVAQSTTGNPTGVYDMSGGAYEYVAAFDKLYQPGQYFTGRCLSASGTIFASVGGSSTKYATAYSNAVSYFKASSFATFTDNGNNISHIGDAIHEVWVAPPPPSTSSCWFGFWMGILDAGWPFEARGGDYWCGSLFEIESYGRWGHFL
ncbi:MAG: hypothetical protein FWF46_08940 [Oscillospiraceae bacterium]|nr:hypothetical protein [Oscillospiraceae bacterium]